MSGRRRTRVLLALVALLGTRVVYAAPAQATAELTAVRCCTQHTGRPSSVPHSRRCCGVSSDADAPAARAAALETPGPVLAIVPGELPAPALGESPRGPSAITAVATRAGPPRYLAYRTIRR